MRLKYKFVVRNVAGQSVALAVGNTNKNFNGMIKLNSVGEYIFKLLENDISFDETVAKITEKYEVDVPTASKALETYLKTLKDNDLIEE